MIARPWLAVALAAAVAHVAAADPIDIAYQRIALDPNDLASVSVGKLRYRGGVDLTSPDRRFGGWSGLRIDRDGRRLVAVSDAGYWLVASIRYDPRGNLAGVGKAEIRPIRNAAGVRPRPKRKVDAEALARTDHSLVVAFENGHRLWLYRKIGGPATSAVVPPPAKSRPPALTGNRGLEALTALGGGRLLALAEGRRDAGELLPGWIVDRGRWHRLSYKGTGGYRPSGAATLPSGDVLVVERRFSWLGGLAARIVRVPGGGIRPGAVLEGVLLASLHEPLVADNFEGIDVGRDDRGRSLIYLISDDNYNIVQRTLLLMFEIEDGGGVGNGRNR